MSERKLRIRKLIEHLVEHNEEHVARFREAASEAEEMGLSETARSLLAAAERGGEVSAALRMALASVG